MSAQLFFHVLRHCWLGKLTCKIPSPIWPIMCLVRNWWDVKPYSTITQPTSARLFQFVESVINRVNYVLAVSERCLKLRCHCKGAVASVPVLFTLAVILVRMCSHGGLYNSIRLYGIGLHRCCSGVLCRRSWDTSVVVQQSSVRRHSTFRERCISIVLVYK